MKKPSLTAFLLLLAAFSAAAACSEEAAPVAPATASASVETFADRIDFADGLFSRDMFDLALEEYKKIQTEFPSDPRISKAHFRAAESLFLLERWDEALAGYRAYLEAFPGGAEAANAQARAGEALYQSGRKDEARDYFLKMADTAPPAAQTTARYYLGKIFYEEEKYDLASANLAPVAADESAMYAPFAQYYLGEIELERDNAAAAASHYEKAAQSAETAILARFGLGRARFLAGDYAGAKSAFQGVWSAPGDSGLGEDAFLNFLNSLYHLEDFAGLVTWRENLDVQLPDPAKRSQGTFLIADSLVRLNRTEEAKAVYDGIILTAPEADKRRARIERVEAIVQSGDIEGALKEIERLIDSGEGDEGPLVLLMSTLLKQANRPLEAVQQLDRLIRQGTADDATMSEAMLTKAYTLIESGKPKRARMALTQFLEKFPANPLAEKALYDVVLLDVRLGDKERAAVDARSYLVKYPSGEYAERVGLRLASLYTDLGDPATARHVFGEYFKRYGGSPRVGEANFLAGYNEQTGGDPAKALEYYRRVTESGVPRDTYVSTLKNRAACAVSTGDTAPAAKDYGELTARFADAKIEPEVYFWLIDFNLTRGNPAAARAALEAFSVRPEASSRGRELEFFTGETLRVEKRFSEAVTHYDSLLTAPGSLRADAFLGRGLVSAALGERDKARADFAQAIREAGEDHETAIRARREQAQLLFEEGKYPEAAKASLAIAILYDDPRYAPDALMQAAKAFESAKDAPNAQKIYRELIERFGQHPLAAQATAKIRKEAA